MIEDHRMYGLTLGAHQAHLMVLNGIAWPTVALYGNRRDWWRITSESGARRERSDAWRYASCSSLLLSPTTTSSPRTSLHWYGVEYGCRQAVWSEVGRGRVPHDCAERDTSGIAPILHIVPRALHAQVSVRRCTRGTITAHSVWLL